MKKLESILLWLLVFLIPSNLFLKLSESTALVDGILVDYLIPKLYLTDLLIFALLVLWIVKNWSQVLDLIATFARRSTAKMHVARSTWLMVVFFALTALKIPTAAHPTAAFWFWLKLLELTLLFFWLKSHSNKLQVTSYKTALMAAVFLQSILGIGQWVNGHNLTPYRLLGESQFTLSTPGIATASFGGTLRVLPLGTTPHPNVLAGFIAIGLIMLWLLKNETKEKSNPKTIAYYVTLAFGLFTLFLTQSLSALIALALAVILISLKRISGTPLRRLLTIGTFLMVILAFIWAGGFTTNSLESTSLSRRETLTGIAFRIIQDNPLFGIGLNNFTAVMPQYGEVETTTRFLQPVHNIYLLLLSETGLIGLALVTLILWKSLRKLYTLHFTLYTPFLMLLAIGMVDHYPYTLQAGQLLIVLTAAFAQSRIKT